MSTIQSSPACPALLIDGSSACFFCGVLGNDGNWLAFEKAPEPALESLFKTVDHVLNEAGIELDAIQSYIYCEGPGSMLGLRLCAMAIETWRRLQPTPGATYAYNSLQLAAADLLKESKRTEDALLISDWKKDTWNGLIISSGALPAVAPIHSDELGDWQGPLYHLPARKGWQQPPTNAVQLSYHPENLPALRTTPGLIQATDGVALYQSGLNTFQKWTPDRPPCRSSGTRRRACQPVRIMKPPHRCWAEIDLAAFERNLKRIQSALPPYMRYVAVVKADAYGHGMPQMVRRLMQSGVDYFAVANITEAAEIRHMGAGWPILLLSPLLPGEEKQVLTHDLIATVSTPEECKRLDQLGRQHDQKVRIHLKIDTGMGRLGIWHEQAGQLLNSIADYAHLQLEGLYTHFSSADTDPEFTRLQRQRFLGIVEVIDHRELLIHADNSAGIDSLAEDSPFNAVRIGLLQFGIAPYPQSALGAATVEPVFSFYTRIGLVKELPAHTDISYGRSYTLTRDSRIAILTAGYGDGIPLQLSNQGSVLLHGQRCPILGRITMDQTIVDVTDCPRAAIGDAATLIGKDGPCEITTTEFSESARTIAWETLCSVTKRVTRIYTGSRDI
jgi:alanine racemase